MKLPDVSPMLVRRYAYLAAAVIVILIGAYIVALRTFLSPQTVFGDMLHNSLATTSVTSETTQTIGHGSLRQSIQIDLGSTQRARSLTTLQQNGSKVETEVIGTRSANYTRYVAIQANQKKPL